MTQSDEALYLTEFQKHGERLDAMGCKADIPMTFHWSMAVKLVAQLQLVLRHPQNKGDARDAARKFVDTLIYSLDLCSPGLGKLLRKGDEPGCDVLGREVRLES